MRYSLLWISLLLFTSFARADGPARKSNVMDFEAEVIDGQKKAPEMFLQLDSEKAEINTILYDRKDFNDFAPINSRLRPLLSDTKKPAEPKK